MKKPMGKRAKIKIFSITTAVIIVLAIWGSVKTVESNRYKRELNASQEKALTDLSAYMESISTNLQKGIYANSSPMLANLSAEIWRDSAQAKNALSELPAQHQELVNTYKFLSQVGDYTMSLNRKVASGQKITAKETESLFSLREIAGSLSEQVSYLLSEEQIGNLGFSSEEEQAEARTIGEASETAEIQFNGALQDAEESLSEYPSLIYDGPFSDHILKKQPELTKGKEMIGIDRARNIAAEILNVDAEDLSGGTEENSNLPCYLFEGIDYTIAITKYGGYLCYILSSKYAGEAKLAESEAVRRAQSYLEKIGYKSMKESYFSANDGICTVNFAYIQDGVVCYSDLIKVGVSLDSGEITSVDARGYIMNHKQHKVVSSPKYTAIEAQSLLSDYLTVKSIKKAVIPLNSGNEAYTYEFYCTGKDNNELLVYINPQTGYEENILILLYLDDGVLTR